MRRLALVLALLAGTIVLAGPASATGTDPKVCHAQVIDKDAYDETVPGTPASDETVILEPAVPGKDAVTKTVYVFEQKRTHKIRESDDPSWNTGPGKDKGWNLIDTKTVELEPAVPGKDAVTKVVHHDAVPTSTIHHDATYKTVEVPCVEEPPTFEPQEVTVCWTMDNSDGVEGTYEWPQHKAAGTFGDCAPAPKCGETVEVQGDKYWARTQDELDAIKAATVLNSPADDAQWEPHGYYSKVFTGGVCDTEVTPVAPTVADSGECDVDPIVTPAETEGIEYVLAWDGDAIGVGDWTVTATAKPGYVIVGQSVFHGHTDTAEPCYEPLTPTTVAAPVIHQPTCANPDVTVDFVTDGDHYHGIVTYPPYSSAADVINVVAFADEGYEIRGPAYWELKVNPAGTADCDTADDNPPATTEVNRALPDTGGPAIQLWIGSGILLLVGAGIVLAGRRRTATK